MEPRRLGNQFDALSENHSAYQASGAKKQEGKRLFMTLSQIVQLSERLATKGLEHFDPESIQIGVFALIASRLFQFQHNEMVTLKIADSYHKDALLADKEFFAAIHSSRECRSLQIL